MKPATSGNRADTASQRYGITGRMLAVLRPRSRLFSSLDISHHRTGEMHFKVDHVRIREIKELDTAIAAVEEILRELVVVR